MTVYSFFGNGTCFQKHRSICGALAAVRGDESRVFVHVEGIPNPWYVHPVQNGRVNRKVIIKPDQLELQKKRFKKKVSIL